MSNYRSNLEELTAEALTNNNIEFEYEAKNIPYNFPVRGGRCPDCGAKRVIRQRTYLPDFTLSDGTVVESKGKLSASERTKFLAIRLSNPAIKIVFVFGANNKLNKRRPERYSDWCEKHGFDFGVKQLPESVISSAVTGK